MSNLKNLKPLNDKITFVFLQDTTGNMFREKSKFGLTIIENKENQLKYARWGKVIKKGKDVSEIIKEGLFILIEPLMWTNHLEFNREKFWVTSEAKILAISEELPINI